MTNLIISAGSFYHQPYNHLVLSYIIVCNRISHITHTMYNISITGQAFIDISFAQLYNFRFFCLLQPRFLTVVDNRVVTSCPITQLS